VNGPLAGLTAALADRYRIERELGAGGMATVYLAHDIKHDRKVALKVLRPDLAATIGVDRFLAEIRVTANLQHPNILGLFDSGVADGQAYYVMPFVEGESLRDRLTREKQLPVADALAIAAGVAAALEYAHAHRVIHRDIKPENILLQSGHAVVADFGIALAVQAAGGERLTQTGLSLGTPQYMSPEQAMGERTLDARTDLYALGVVTYEMLVGEPPFTGPNAQAIVAKVLTESPRSVRASRPSVPEHVEVAIARALEKLPADRWTTAGQFADVLLGRATGALAESTMSRRAASAASGARGRVRTTRERITAAVPWLGWVALAVVVGIGGWTLRGTADPPVTRFTLAIPASERFVPVSGRPVHFAPDGRSVIYAGRGEKGTLTLYEYRLDELSPRAIPGTELASDPFVSPNGRFVGAVNHGKVNVFPVSGGAGTPIANVLSRGEAWSANGQIIMVDGRFLSVVSAAGGQVERISVLDSAAREWYPRDPLALPDGKTVLFRTSGPNGDVLGVLNLDTKSVRRVEGPIGDPIGMIDGWLLYGREGGSIMATPFDPASTRTLMNPVQVLEGAFWKYQGGVAASLSTDGSLVYVRSPFTNAELTIVDEHGATSEVLGVTRVFDPRFSPDGHQVAFSRLAPQGTDTDIWVYDIPSKVTRRITSHGDAFGPAWTADGKRIAFISRDTSRKGMSPWVAWWVPADKSGPEERLAAVRAGLAEVTFSNDGTFAVLRSSGGTRPDAAQMWMLTLAGDRTPVALFESPSRQTHPAISRDSRWLAYVSDESRTNEVYVRAMSGGGGSVQISQAGGVEPQWASDGRLLYRTADSLVAATLTFAPKVAVLRRRALFGLASQSGTARSQYSVHPTGQQIVLQRVGSGQDFDMVVVLHWATELREKLRQAGKR
jgi:serine/threonine-protein kinase